MPIRAPRQRTKEEITGNRARRRKKEWEERMLRAQIQWWNGVWEGGRRKEIRKGTEEVAWEGAEERERRQWKRVGRKGEGPLLQRTVMSALTDTVGSMKGRSGRGKRQEREGKGGGEGEEENVEIETGKGGPEGENRKGKGKENNEKRYGTRERRSVARVWIKEAELQRIALPEEAGKKVELESWLKEAERKQWTEADVVVEEKEAWDEMRRINIENRCERSVYGRLVKRLLERDMVDIEGKPENIVVVNGLHAVEKTGGKLRLIFDGRRVNKVWKQPPPVELPHFKLAEDWGVDEDEEVWAGKIDLDNYYYRLGMPEWTRPFLALPPIRKREVQEGRTEEGDSGDDKVWPRFKVLPMGLAWSVWLAQTAHLNMLADIEGWPKVNRRLGGGEELWAMVYIDDVIIIGKGQEEDTKWRVNEAVRKACDRYEAIGMRVNKEKVEWASQELRALGCEVRGKEAKLVPIKDKWQRLVRETWDVSRRETASIAEMESIVGDWVWWLLLRRSYLALIFDTYRWIKKIKKGETWKRGEGRRKRREVLWACVRRELKEWVGIAPYIEKKWRKRWLQWEMATDASKGGAGAMVRMKQKESTGEGRAANPSSGWELWYKRRWENKEANEHINVLELKALVEAMNKVAEKQGEDGRLRVLVDSMVVLGAKEKGRSKSYGLNRELKRLMAIEEVAGVECRLKWVPTGENPADGPSRDEGREGAEMEEGKEDEESGGEVR